MLALGTSLLLLLAFSSSSSIALPYILDQAPQTPFNVPSLKQSSEEPWANALKHSGLVSYTHRLGTVSLTLGSVKMEQTDQGPVHSRPQRQQSRPLDYNYGQ